MTKKQTKAVLEKIVTRAVTKHALYCGVASVEAWARDWLSGKDRTAAWAAAAWAAGAADAAEAAREAEVKHQIADVRAVLAA